MIGRYLKPDLKPDEAGAMMAVSPKTLANWRASGYRPPLVSCGWRCTVFGWGSHFMGQRSEA